MKNFTQTLVFIIALFIGLNLQAEGTKQWMPTTAAASHEVALMLYNSADGNGRLGTTGCAADERIYIAVSSNFLNERIYIGMNVFANTNSYFRVMAPNGVQVYPAVPGTFKRVLSAATGQTGEGYISSLARARFGPRETNGMSTSGYDAISITPTMAGNYYIEFNGANSTVYTPITRHQVSYFDVTVANVNGTPNLEGDDIPLNGRLFAYNWSLYNLLNGLGFNIVDTLCYFVYNPTDSVVLAIGWDDVKPGGWNIGFNSYGVRNLTDKNEARKSVAYGSAPNQAPQTSVVGTYPILFNNPDLNIFPSAMVAPRIDFFNYRGCDSISGFDYSINKAGQLEVLLDFNGNNRFDAGTRDRIMVQTVNAGTGIMLWNGLDGLGDTLAVGDYTLTVKYQIGIAHMPLGDVEENKKGFNIRIIRPMFTYTVPGKLYYDHSIAGAPFTASNYDYAGCVSGCNTWAGNDPGDMKYINTWMYFAEKIEYHVVSVTHCSTIDLPIELISFDAKRNSNTEVELYWATASELNNSGFEIERMLERETSFTKIGFVDGAGTTDEIINYNFSDNNAAAGVSYYRLRQVDFDGSYSYSDVRAVSNDKVSTHSINIFPNPVKDVLNIQFKDFGTEVESAMISIYNAQGLLVHQEQIAINNGQITRIESLQDLNTGNYLLRINYDNGSGKTMQFVKL